METCFADVLKAQNPLHDSNEFYVQRAIKFVHTHENFRRKHFGIEKGRIREGEGPAWPGYFVRGPPEFLVTPLPPPPVAVTNIFNSALLCTNTAISGNVLSLDRKKCTCSSPVRKVFYARIEFKIATHWCTPFIINVGRHLSNMDQFNTTESRRRQLRSSTTNAAFVVRTRTQFGKRAFSVCGPSIWNQIPPHIRNLHSVPAFRKALKTLLFLQLSTL